MIKGVHHISIIVSSELSVAFYERLGFASILRKDRGYDKVVIMKGYGIQLELFVDSRHPKRAINPESMGIRYISLQVDSLDSILNEFECGEVKIDWCGNRYSYIYDPDGLPIQFHEGE